MIKNINVVRRKLEVKLRYLHPTYKEYEKLYKTFEDSSRKTFIIFTITSNRNFYLGYRIIIQLPLQVPFVYLQPHPEKLFYRSHLRVPPTSCHFR